MNDDERVRAWREETEATPDRVDRIARAVARPSAPAPAWPRWSLATAALAAAAWLLWPQPVAPLSEDLRSTEVVTRTLPADGIVLRYAGAGHLEDHDVQWASGTLDVEVPPDQGLNLAVHTREAKVEVVGTGFVVERSARGTDVSVRHGRVRVTCVGADPVLLDPGMAQNCPPVSAAALLARARADREAGAPLEVVLGEVDAALARAGAADPVADELHFLRAELRYLTGDRTGAAEEIAALRASGTRVRSADEVARLSAAIAVAARDCDRVRAELATIAILEASDQAMLRSCGAP